MTWLRTFGKTLRSDNGQRAILFGVLLGLSALFIRNTFNQGQDFAVFWRTGNLIDSFTGMPGERVYSPLRDGTHTYKYPPWSGFLWMPFGLFSVQTAKCFWGVIQAISLFFVVNSLLSMGFGVRATLISLVAWLGIWIVHGMDGQITLPMLAISLWAFSKEGFWGWFVLCWALSMKATTIVGAFPRAIEGLRRPKWILFGIIVATSMSAPVFYAEQTGSMLQLVKNWIEASQSGETWKHMLAVVGRPNQGLPILFRRIWPGVSEVWVALGMICFAVPTWFYLSRKLSRNERFFGYLALAVVTHPLAWFHSFVLAFPAGVAAISRWRVAKKRWRFAIGVGVIGVGSITEKTFGAVGLEMELASIKSWAVLVLLAVIVAVPSAGKQARRARV
jgi:hypothetical protein